MRPCQFESGGSLVTNGYYLYAYISGPGRRFSPLLASDRERVAIMGEDWKSPIYTLLSAQALMYFLSHGSSRIFSPSDLCLNIRDPQWWQMLSSGFAFINSQHLAEVLFFTYIFGRVIERHHGMIGLWLSYIAAVIGKK